MRIVQKTFKVYTFTGLSDDIQQKLVNKHEIDPEWYQWTLEDINENFEVYHGIKATVTGFDLEAKNITIKNLIIDNKALSDYFIDQNFSRQFTKAEYYKFKSESRFILSLDINLKRYNRNDSFLDIEDPYSPYYEGLNNVRIGLLDAFIEGVFTDYKHVIIKQLQSEYDHLTSEETIKAELTNDCEYLESGEQFYE
jgi:hypothetical protein